MVLSDPDLWSRLRAVPIGPGGAALPFAQRLARDNGWRQVFADRVIEEYRRFLYLCCVADHPVTPSDEVDQAWHLHLTYTRSYWDDLCRGVLGRPLHHGPTEGGPDERRKYDAQYRATLAAYAREFGEPPPTDIWPDPATRFGTNYVRIDRNAVWLVDRRRSQHGLRLTLGALALGLVLAACTELVADLPSMTGNEKVIAGVVAVLVIAGVIRSRLASPSRRRRRRDEGGGSGCGSGCGDSGCGSGCD